MWDALRKRLLPLADPNYQSALRKQLLPLSDPPSFSPR